MKLLTERQITRIVNNVTKVIQLNDIELLSKSSYNFLYLCSGFIAHYNLYGFRDYYRNVDDLLSELIEFQPMNQWNNFRPGEQNADYYHQKRDIYNRIVNGVTKFLN